MRRVLPGGAVLGGSNRGGGERPVACRPRAAVLERTRPSAATVVEQSESKTTTTVESETEKTRFDPGGRLPTVKLFLEVLAVLVGLIGAILALFGLSRK